jgi:hypothetical protein
MICSPEDVAMKMPLPKDVSQNRDRSDQPSICEW